jgi:hypothetical protein
MHFKSEGSYNSTGIYETVDCNGISVYPNPTKGIIRISLNDKVVVGYVVEVYDNIGCLLLTLKNNKLENDFSLDLSKFSTGYYMVRIYTDNILYTRKF